MRRAARESVLELAADTNLDSDILQYVSESDKRFLTKPNRVRHPGHVPHGERLDELLTRLNDALGFGGVGSGGKLSQV